ncbi:alkene reductase [Nocardia cyriacigeorgica]|uniref:alkene reductase n=1 Tax=Nocardia cyriacigeorgica TaxID=135487 RepID=UPI0013B5F0C4|nr:alkene reductase [Nocardia cyriacigeorgica]NEW52772.1 alkene reductase [Nocardia cyriacigeorgica]
MTNAARTTNLFDTATLGTLQLPNRLIMAPMSRQRADADGTPNALMAAYYAQRAGAGLIVAEAATPNLVGKTFAGIPAIYADSHIAGWRQVTDAVRTRGGRMYLQLQHGGRIGHPDNTGLTPIAPSPIPLPGTVYTADGSKDAVVPRQMTIDEIHATVADFAAAARNAVAAGFDGVEVHSANGFLLHQFLSDNTNQRTDDYGGSVDNRIRFTVEVVEAVAAAIGPERVGVRIAPAVTANGIAESDTAELYPALVEALNGRGLSYLHVVFADPASPVFGQIAAHWQGTLIANPYLGWGEPLPDDGGKARAEELLAAGADLVSLGRSFLANPDLVDRLRSGAPINQTRDAYFYGGSNLGYTDYPELAAAAV